MLAAVFGITSLEQAGHLSSQANRALFAPTVDEALAGHHHDGTSLGLLLVDLDDFEAVNDVSGQARRPN